MKNYIYNKSLVRFHKLGTFKNLKDFDDLESRISNLGEKDLLQTQRKLLKLICIEDHGKYAKKLQGMINNLVGDAGAIIGLADKKLSGDKNVVPSEKISPSIKRKYSMALGIDDAGTDGYSIDSQAKCDKAIQFKWFSHGENVTVGIRKLSTFFSDAENFPLREIYTNAKAVTRRLANKTRIKVVTRKDLKKRWTPERLKSLEKMVAGSIPPKANMHTLKPHQKRALNGISKGFKTNDRGQYISACGTGKTFTYIRLRERLKSKKTVVFVPSIALAGQLLEEFVTHGRYNKNLTFTVLCSDPSIATELDSMTFESTELDYHVTTNHVELEQRDKESEEHLVICTYHSVPVLIKSKISFELGIFDEAHRTTGSIGDYFSLALRDSNVKIKKRLFATATPKFVVATKNNITNSMDNEDIYGKVFHRLSNSEAVDEGLIVPIKIITVVITKKDLNRELIKRGKTHLDKIGNVRTNYLAKIIAFEKAIKKYKLKKIFAFNSTIKASRRLAEDEEVGAYAFLSGIECFHINGAIRSHQRASIIDNFREAESAMVTNVRCLVEGVDLPAVDCVAFFDPRKSVIDIVQAVGRPARVDGKKKCGYVFVPIYVDFNKDEDAETAAYDSSYGVLFDVINALAEHDDSLQQRLTELQRMLGAGETKGSVERCLADIYETVGFDPVTLETLKKSISTNLLGIFRSRRCKTGRWERFIGTLTKVKEDMGDCNNYSHPMFSDEKLLKSVRSIKSNTRSSYNKKLLLPQRVKQLNDLGFIWDVLDAQFEENFHRLKEFKKEHGHCNVSETRVNKNGTGARTELGKLGTWVCCLRINKNKNALSDEQIKRLDSIGFDWNPLETVWNQRFEELKAFKKKHGHFRVPNPCPENKKLGTWVTVQRGARFGKQRKTKIDPEKIKKLDSIGFIWNPKEHQFELNFQEGIKELENFMKENGHCEISTTFRKESEGAKLCSFIQMMRKSLKQNLRKSDRSPFSQKHIDALNKIGFAWDALESRWQKNFQDLLKFKEKHGHYDVSTKERVLQPWTFQQRKHHEANTLSKERVEKLNSIGFNWKCQFFDKLLQKSLDLIQRIRNHEKKYGSLDIMAEKDKKLRLQFEKDKKLLFKLRRQRDGRSAKTQYADIIIAEVDKQLRTWEWEESEKIPEIKKIKTKQTYSATGKVYHSFAYAATITLNKKTIVYKRKDRERLKEMLDEVLKAGRHIKFPKEKHPNKGNYGKKRIDRMKHVKDFWAKRKWTEEKIKILRENYKSMTDEKLSKTLFKTHSPKAISAERHKLGFLHQ